MGPNIIAMPTERTSRFEPKSGPRDVDKALLSYINNLGCGRWDPRFKEFNGAPKRVQEWGPQDSVQLVYKGLNLWFMVDITIDNYGECFFVARML